MTCLTCHARPARWLARLDGDQWPVCDRCKDQGAKTSARLTFTLLERDEGLAGGRPPETMWGPA